MPREGMVLFARNASSKPPDSWSVLPITMSFLANGLPSWGSTLLSVPKPHPGSGVLGRAVGDGVCERVAEPEVNGREKGMVLRGLHS